MEPPGIVRVHIIGILSFLFFIHSDAALNLSFMPWPTAQNYVVLYLRILLEEWSILSKQGSIFLENQLSEQAELTMQGGIFLQRS